MDIVAQLNNAADALAEGRLELSRDMLSNYRAYRRAHFANKEIVEVCDKFASRLEMKLENKGIECW